MGTRRYAGQNGQGLYGDEEDSCNSPVGSPYYPDRTNLPRGRQVSRSSIARQQSSVGFSTEDDSDEEPLPQGYGDRADADAEAGEGSRQGMIFRDGQWFTALDERYLLPLFSNSVTARRHHAKHHAKKAARKASSVYNGDSPSGSGTPQHGLSLDISRDQYAPETEDAGSENGKNKSPVTRPFA
jgi:sodium/hydrogen exchanger-like protein 6/7